MSKARWQKSLWDSFVSRFSLRSRRQSRRRSPATRYSGYAQPAAESLESRVVPVVSVSFNAGLGELTLATPAGTDNLRVVSGFTTVGSSIVPATRVFAGPGGNVLVATLTAATNQNIDTIIVSGGAAASLTVIGNSSTLTDINMGTTPILSLPNGTNINVVSTVGVEFGNTTITGNLQVDAAGAITQSAGAALTVVGTADLDTDAADTPGTGFAITLANNNTAGVPVNSFGYLVLDGAAINIREGNPMNLGSVDAAALTLFSTGSVTAEATVAPAPVFTGEVNATGITSINTGKGGNITLTSALNDFSTINLSGANIVLVEAPTTAIDLGNITASGNLDVTSPAGGNAIANSGNLSVAGVGTFTTAGATVTLTAGTVNFGSISVLAPAAAVTIDEDSATNLHTITATTLSVTSAGAITDLQANTSVTVTGTTTLLAGANAITLDNVTNDFQGPVRFVGSDVKLVDGAEGVELGVAGGGNASNATTLTVTATRPAGGAAAPIIDTAGAVVTVTGKADLNAIGSGPTDYQDITLNDGTWGGLALRALNATITEVGGTDLFNITITGATFSVTATTGNITNGIAPLPGGKQGYHNISAGNAAVSFTTTQAGADITILNAAQVISTFGTLSVDTTGPNGDASISEGFGTVLNNIDVEGNFTLNAIDGIPTPPTTVLRSVTQSGAGTIDVDGLTTINASPSFEVTLLNPGNDFGTGLGVTGRNVSIDDDDVAGVALDRSTIAGNFSLNSAGPITQAASGTFGRLQVVGTATLTGTSILLDRRDPVSALAGAPFENASNTMGTLLLTSAGNVTIIEKGATTLGATGGSIGGNLTIVSTGAITDSGVVQVTGETTMASVAYSAASGAVVTNTAASFVGPTVTITAPGHAFVVGQSVAVVGVSGGGAVGFNGVFTITAVVPGVSFNYTSVGVGGVPTAFGATSAATTAGTITLDSTDGAFVPLPTNNFVGEINLRGTNVVLKDLGTTELGAILATGTLTVTSTGDVTNPTEFVSVGGAATFIKSTAAAANLTLGTTIDAQLGSLSAVGQTAAVSFTDVTLEESNAGATAAVQGTSLGAMRVGGNLVIDAEGAVTDTGTITVTGTTAITTTADDIILNSVANNFMGDFSFTGAANVSIVDSAGGIEFGTSTGATLTVNATGGDVTDDGAAILTIGGGTGAVNITALSNDIQLNNVLNQYGILTLKGATADIAEAAASTPLTLGNVSLSGTLNLVAGGAVTQAAGSSVIAGNTTINAATSVTLTNVNPTNTGNRLGTLAVTAPTSIAVIENDAIVLGNINTAGPLSLTANGSITQVAGDITAGATTLTTSSGKDITLNTVTNSFDSLTVTGQNVSITEDNAGVAGTTIGGTVKGNLTLTHSGIVTNNGALLVSGSATINANVAAVASVSLSNASNQFGSISVFGSIPANNPTAVTIVESGNTVLGIVTPTGALSVTSTGNITDTGVDATSLITVAGGTATFVAGGSITLDDDDNNFSTVDFDGVNVTLNDTVGTLVLAASEATGNLTVEAIGNVTQTGILDIDGQTTVETDAASVIDLDTAGNLFGGTVSLDTGSGAIDLADADGALDLGRTDTTGTLTVTSTGGGVTQSGAITVGNTVITANTAAGSDIILTHISNAFGTLDLTSNGDIAIREAGEIDVAAAGIQAAGTLLLQSTAAVGTAIEQAGAITAGNTTLIATGTNKNITLTNAGNVFGTLSITGGNTIGGTVSIVENAAVDLGASNVSGTLIVNSTGNTITDSGTLKVSGTLNLTAGAGDITLNEAASTFGPLDLAANNITVTDSGAVDLLDIDATGNFVLIYGGDVTDSGIVDVGGTTSITPQLPFPGSSQIILDGVDANLADGAILDGAVSMTGTAISLTNAGAVGTILGNVIASSTLTINSTTGNIAAAGVQVQAVGLAIFNASDDPTLTPAFAPVTRFDILIGGAGTNFNTVRLYGNDADLSGESDDLDLGESNLTADGITPLDLGSLTVITVAGFVQPGNITDSGTLTIDGTVSLNAGDNDNNPLTVGTAAITLDQASSTFGTVGATDLILNGSNIYVKDNGDVELGSVLASGSLTIVSGLDVGDDITQTAATGIVTTNAAFGALFNAGAGAVTLANAGPNNFAGTFAGIGGAGVNIQE